MGWTRPSQIAALLACAGAAPAISAQAPPRVVSLVPAHGAVDLVPDKVVELVVTFDGPMKTSSYSFCGGGPTFPELRGKPLWRDERTCVLPVTLQPGQTYSTSLNGPGATGFQSAEGIELAPVAWRFSTLPRELRPLKHQRLINKQALRDLANLLATRYSYYDLREVNWEALTRPLGTSIRDSRSDFGWVHSVAKMLAPLGDLHLYLKIGDSTIPTATRAVDPMFRGALLAEYLTKLEQPDPGLLLGETADGIAYLWIGSFTKDVDFGHVDTLLEQLCARESPKLVLDVRTNSGGDEAFAQRVAAWFVEGEKVYAKNDSRTGKGPEAFGPVFSRKIAGREDEQRFGGEVTLLTSRFVMSSAEAFVLMMKQADRCTVVGQPTFGSSGNPKPHALSNGAQVFIPSWRAMRPDGSIFEREGIAPDVLVEVDAEDLKERDPILEAALAHLRRG